MLFPPKNLQRLHPRRVDSDISISTQVVGFGHSWLRKSRSALLNLRPAMLPP
jgi:hypothetical protein